MDVLAVRGWPPSSAAPANGSCDDVADELRPANGRGRRHERRTTAADDAMRQQGLAPEVEDVARTVSDTSEG